MKQRGAIALLLLLAGCANTTPGELFTPASKSNVQEKLDWQTTYQKKRIAMDGFLFLRGSSEESAGSVEMALYTQPMGEGERLVDLKAGTGTGKDEVHLPTIGKGKSAGYQRTELKVDVEAATYSDHDGKTHPLKDKMRLSGTVLYVDHFQGGFSHMADPMNKGKDIYAFSLSDVRFDPATAK